LRLSWSQFDGSAITLRQSKTGVLLAVPVAKELRIALNETPRQSPTILICETTKRTWKPYFFRHEFRRIANMADLTNLQFLDLRRTAVVRLAEAGCTVPEIAAITGHQLDRTARILETYPEEWSHGRSRNPQARPARKTNAVGRIVGFLTQELDGSLLSH
jgi:integrase